ncbi:MAG: hypothetical protein P8Z35_15180 [Ignavibacteriaceae bacterium]
MKEGKIIFVITLIMSLFLLYSCSNENLVGVNKNNTSKGSVVLKVVENTIPSGVQYLTAFLTRQDNDTLTASIDVGNDSLNILTMQNVPAGNWHLIVNASNSDGKILYSGETGVTILEDETIDVYLTLTSVGSGTGNIEIYIDWGSNWKDYFGNPILSKAPDISNVYGVIEPKILFENVGDVIYENGKYKMYYNGFRDQYGEWSIGLAVSDNGINWEKYNAPVLTPSGNEFQIVASSIIKLDNKYYMYYTNRNYPYYSICLAISQDGLNWQKYDQNPILKPLKDWEGTGILFPSVLIKDNKYEMVYMNVNQNNWAFGKATSVDGLSWLRSDSNPFFTAKKTFNNWAYKIAYPDYVRINSEYRIYYTGYIINEEGIEEGNVALITNE